MPRTDQPDHSPFARPFSRRQVLSGLSGGAAACLLPLRAALSATPRDQNTSPLIVGGTAESICGQWATLLAPVLAADLRYATPFPLCLTTGWDGVTGGNLFDIQQEQANPPAGLIVPGSGLIAALRGDTRVHYDAQRWLPVFMSCQPTVAVGKVSLRRSFTSFLQGHPLRVAVSTLSGPELPTLVALDLLGMNPLPQSGYATPDAAVTALKAGSVEAIQLPFDENYEARLATLQDDDPNNQPLFSNVLPNSALRHQRLPPDFTTVFTQTRRRTPPARLYDVWKTAASAASLKAGLMLPNLSQPDLVARFRHAAEVAASDAALRTHAKEQNQNLTAGIACAALYADMMPDLERILALRRWLSVNSLHWRDTPASPTLPLPAAQQNTN